MRRKPEATPASEPPEALSHSGLHVIDRSALGRGLNNRPPFAQNLEFLIEHGDAGEVGQA